MLRRLIIKTTLLLPLVAACSATASDYNPDVLKVALLPDENVATIIQDNKPLASYLEKRLGKEIELIVTTDYSSMIEAVRFGRIDIAYFGPASYTIAKDKMQGGEIDIEPFAARVKDGSTTYQSVLISNTENGPSTLDDIKGSGIDIAFGDPASTSSHFAPKYTLSKVGVNDKTDYKSNYVGSHDAVAINVQRGNATVGGLSRPIYERLVENNSIDASKITVLGYSEEIPQYPWVVRTDLSADLRSSIKQSFYELKPGTLEGDAVLKPFKADGFASIVDSDYNIIRAIRKTVVQ